MTAYNIIQKHPEWLELMACGATPKKDIQRVAKRHIEEMEGKQNFSKLISDDIEELLKARYSILKSPLREEIENFDGIEFDGVIIKPDYSNIARKEHLAEVCAIFIKAVITELSGKAVCTAAQVEEWRERYAVKLEGLKGKIQQVKKTDIRLKPISDNRTKEIFTKLIDYKYIDCEESAFLWYFGEERHRRKEQPRKIKWVGTDIKIFSLFWKLINKFGSDNNVKWKIARDYFIIPEDWENEYISLSEKSKKEFFKEKARQAEETQYENREEIDRVIDIFSSIINEEEIKKEIERWDAIIQMIKKNREYKYSPDKNERQLYNPKFDIE